VTWRQLREVFGNRGPAARCYCQRYKLAVGEAFKHFSPDVRAERLRQQACCDRPRSSKTSGLVAFVGETPVGWCAVEPRTAYPGLLRAYRVPWEGREEDKADETIWAVTCLFTRAGFRKCGVSYRERASAMRFCGNGGSAAQQSFSLGRPG